MLNRVKLHDGSRAHVQVLMPLAAARHHRYDLILYAARLEKQHMATAITLCAATHGPVQGGGRLAAGRVIERTRTRHVLLSCNRSL